MYTCIHVSTENIEDSAKIYNKSYKSYDEHKIKSR